MISTFHEKRIQRVQEEIWDIAQELQINEEYHSEDFSEEESQLKELLLTIWEKLRERPGYEEKQEYSNPLEYFAINEDATWADVARKTGVFPQNISRLLNNRWKNLKEITDKMNVELLMRDK